MDANKNHLNEDGVEEINQADTLDETDKKCEACGGTMDFDPNTGMLVCPYCGNSVVIEEECFTPTRAEELSFAEAEERGNCDWGNEKKTVVCKNCGAETLYDALDTAGVCPYCGSNQVMEASTTNTLAPGGVCPFRFDAEEADKKFRKWIKKRWFCPFDLRKNAGRVSFTGIYLPYWTFDSQTMSHYTARYGITRTVTVGHGDNRRTKTYTEWHYTRGRYDKFFNDCLVQGSIRHNMKMLDQIAPFDTEDNLLYRPEYLAGFIAERYSVGLDSAWSTAQGKIERDLRSAITQEIRWRYHADYVDSLRMTTYHDGVTYKYLMLPVWMSHYEYKSKTYHFMVNGQTGKVGGKTPLSFWQVFLAVVGGAATVALLYLLFYFLGGI